MAKVKAKTSGGLKKPATSKPTTAAPPANRTTARRAVISSAAQYTASRVGQAQALHAYEVFGTRKDAGMFGFSSAAKVTATKVAKKPSAAKSSKNMVKRNKRMKGRGDSGTE